MKSTLFSALFCAGLLLGAPAFASDAPPPPPPGASADEDPGEAFMANFAEISEKIGLSPDQQTKIKDLFYKSGKTSIDLKATMAKTELDLRHSMSGEEIDDKVVLKALDAHLAAEAAFKRNRIQQLLDLRKIVSAEQWKQLDQMRRERREERREDGERGGRRGMLR